MKKVLNRISVLFFLLLGLLLLLFCVKSCGDLAKGKNIDSSSLKGKHYESLNGKHVFYFYNNDLYTGRYIHYSSEKREIKDFIYKFEEGMGVLEISNEEIIELICFHNRLYYIKENVYLYEW